MDKKQLLFIQPSQRPYYKDPQKNMFYYMSEYFSGDAISCLTDRHAGQMDDINEININLPSFNYHLRQRSKLPRIFGILDENLFYLKKGIALCRNKNYDAIVAHPTALTGVVGLILKKYANTKLIVEIPTHPTKFFTETAKRISKIDRFKAFIVRYLVNIISNNADMVKLMYPGQMDEFPTFNPKKTKMFFDFVPISSLPNVPINENNNYILLVGTPWYLKGVDILVQSFNNIMDEFSDIRLKIVGKNNDKESVLNLALCPDRLDLYDHLPNNEVIDLMSKCSIFVLPSRTEGIPRVLQEAMMLKRPVIASNVGGIPQIIKNNINGMLINNSADELTHKLRFLLSNKNFANTIAEQAHKDISTNFSEKKFVEHYVNMVDALEKNI